MILSCNLPVKIKVKVKKRENIGIYTHAGCPMEIGPGVGFYT